MEILNPNKAHGHDKINIRMLKICRNSLCRPLELIFNNCLANGIFPSDWKKGNMLPVHKKNDKNNYPPISLLPMCSKILEQVIFNEIFGFFIENDLIAQHQSSFKPGDSCSFYQLLRKYTNHLMKVLMFVVYLAGVLQEAGDADSRTRTRSQV